MEEVSNFSFAIIQWDNRKRNKAADTGSLVGAGYIRSGSDSFYEICPCRNIIGA
jgi:hypothetical protein